MIHQSPPRKRIAGLIGATAATALAAGILAPMAVASDTNSSLPIVDPTATNGSLYIYKYVDTPPVDTTDGANPNNGTELDTSGWTAQTPVSGVTYTIYQVLSNGTFIELNDAAGWQLAAAGEGIDFSVANDNLLTTSAGDSAIGWSLGSVAATCTTDATGFCGGAAQSLPLGLYYVVESISAGGTTPPGVVASADPFLVTLPMANPQGTGWLTDGNNTYAVYVYPKNPIQLPTKVVDSSGADSVGGTVVYTIASDLTQTPLSQYVINDPIDARLTVQSVDLYYSNSSDSAVTIGSLPIQPGDTAVDSSLYTVTDGVNALTLPASDPAEPVAVGDPGVDLTITFTDPDGLADLEAHSQVGTNPVTLKVVITTEVNKNLNTQSAAGGDAPLPGINSPIQGVVPNLGSATINGSQTYTNTTDSDPTGVEVFAYFGGVALHKQDGNTGDAITSGDAVFRIFTTFDAAQAYLISDGDTSLQALDVDGNPAYEFTTDATGMAGILGLHYGTDATTPACTINDPTNTLGLAVPNDFTPVDISSTNGSQYNGAAVSGNEYWVVEVHAPAGYSPLAEPVAVCVVGVLDNATGVSSYDDWWINNTKVNAGFDLPFTAWMGDHYIIVAAVLLVVGLAAYEVNRRRRAAVAVG